MTKEVKFNGFPKETVKFLKDLAKNNEKPWFNANRKKYELFFLKPAKDFIVAMSEKLEKLSSDIQGIPAVNKSIFKIYKDVRFSKDKTPFKTHLGLWFWEGEGPRMECSGFYFHLDPPNLMLGVGIYMFPKHQLEEFRNSVVHVKHGPELIKAIKKIEKSGYTVGGEHYKRVPRGFDAEHKNADYLLYNGMFGGIETKIPKEFYTSDIIDYCFKAYKDMLPLHQWLVKLTERAR